AIPELTIYTACIDPDLRDNGLISPGIGDPVQRLNLRSPARA
ncbi:MAG: uracil phosphoribosyltransferase, partial [Synechococcus sp. TMED20]